MTMGHKMGQIVVICLMAFASTTSSPLGASRSISDGLKSHLSNDQDNKLAIKKAYTYVSEYKRLPVYNFGIGKRWDDGNGIKSAQPYSFGFGKRANSKTTYPIKMGLDYVPYENYDDYTKDEMSIDTRSDGAKRGGRMRQYDFGLGKRNAVSSLDSSFNVFDNRENIEESKKRFKDNLERRFLYGLSNAYEDDRDNARRED